MAITVNGVAIGDEAIAAEMQYHPASSLAAAHAAAAQALVVRELLAQEARRLGFADGEDDTALDRLLAEQIPLADPDEEECRAYYRAHPERFRTQELYEAHHILLAADPADAAAMDEAASAAKALIAELERHPGRFAELAALHSACASKREGGSLGQVTRADIAPELATFLAALDEGQLCPVPVKTRHGVHVVRLDRRAASAALPYEAARERIAAYLAENGWRQAIGRYIDDLAKRAQITGLEIRGREDLAA